MIGDRDDLSRALSLVDSLPADSDKPFVVALVAAMEDVMMIFSEALKAHESQFKLSGSKVGLYPVAFHGEFVADSILSSSLITRVIPI